MSDPAPRVTEEVAPPAALEARARRNANLRAIYQSMQAGEVASRGPKQGGGPAERAGGVASSGPAKSTERGRGWLWGVLAGGAAFVVSKLKFLGLLAGALKFKTLATMLLSVGAYALEWGLPFAVGLVLLIFVHELGHVIVLRREGIPAGAPVFIPFLGAFIAMKGRPRDAYVEAKVALGGPVLGSLAAWAVLAWGYSAGSAMIVGIGHVGVLLNLFNLIPVSPLDGGRVAGAFSRTFWIAGYVVGVAAWFVLQSPLLLIALLVGLFTLWQRWRNPVPGYDAISPRRRLLIGAAYAGLLLALVATLPQGAIGPGALAAAP